MELDIDAVEAWFTRLYQRAPEADLVNVVRTDDWAGTFVGAHDAGDILGAVVEYDMATPVGIYHRITSVTEAPAPGKRGDASQSHALPGFWADIDIAGPGHKSNGRLPENKREARAIVINSCLPEPSLWVDSGGGLYPWWLLETPELITDANRDDIARLSLELQEELRRAARDLDMECEPMADLARVLRVPGTINRKADPKMCRVIQDNGTTFTIAELRGIVPETRMRVSVSTVRNDDTTAVYEGLPDGPMCRVMSKKLSKVAKAMTNAETGGRHAACLSGIGSLISLGNIGHTGAREAVEEFRTSFDAAKPESDDVEWSGMVDYIAERTDVVKDRSCCGAVTFSDAHMAERAVREHLGGAFIWSEATKWMTWTGSIWEAAAESVVVEAVRQWVVEEYRDAVDQLRFDESKKTIVDGWKSMLSRGRITSVVSLAQGILGFDASKMDADPDILNVKNGVVNLKTRELMPHDPSRLVSKTTGVDYDPNAQDKGLSMILSALPEAVHDWMQIRVGQAATGHPLVREPMILLQGGGSNGKTTLMQAIGFAIGSYFTLVSDGVLLGTAQRDETMDLFGARLALIEELPEDGRIDVVRLKKLIDTPQMEGHHMYRSKVTWDVTHSLFVTTNPRPQVSGVDHATWRRLALVRCPFTFVRDNPATPNERVGDHDLRNRVLRKDPKLLRAVLKWIIDGAYELYKNDMLIPETPELVNADTREWRMEADMILAYWDEQVEADPGSHVITGDLYTDFKAWMESKGNRPWSEKVFVQRWSGHTETLKNRVERKQTATPSTLLSRPKGAYGEMPERPRIWLGVKFAAGEKVGSEKMDNPFASSV